MDLERCDLLCVTKDCADSAFAEYAKFLRHNNIDRNDETNPFAMGYRELIKLSNAIYDCKTKEDFNILYATIEKYKKMLSENTLCKNEECTTIKLEHCDMIYIVKSYANTVLAKYMQYTRTHNIDRNDKENPFAKARRDLSKIYNTEVYDCETKEDFDELRNKIRNYEKMLNENVLNKKGDNAMALDKCDMICITKDSAHNTLAKYTNNFIKNNIDGNDQNHPLVKARNELVDICYSKVYDCELKEDFDILRKRIKELENILSENI